MAYSSSTHSVQQKNQVYMNFDEDTGFNFVSHLQEALERRGINTLTDVQLKRGGKISWALLKAIEESKIFIIVLSDHYAFSCSCLERLCKILECKNRYGQIVLPIFYHVEPFDVQKQTGSFAEAFAKHQIRFEYDRDKVERWRAALTEVAYLSGFHLEEGRFGVSDAARIKDIVEDIWWKLNRKLSSDVKSLLGMESPKEKFHEPVPQKNIVFLSSRGETRDNFTSHLYEALRRKGIRALIGNDLDGGEEISQALLKAIEESKISIVVLSKNDAFSSWCLNELCKILECKNRYGQIVVPIFYHVDRSDVRKKRGSLAEEFAKHQVRFEYDRDKVRRWRAALTEVACLCGFHLGEESCESECIKHITKDICAEFPQSVQRKNQVFLSFRGKDTGNNFTRHLHVALIRKGIDTSFDYVFQREEEIFQPHLTTIEESKISIIVLSKNYASSSWHLDELSKILECKEGNGQKVIPIFYDVDPSEVRKQIGSFGEAFAEYEESFKYDTDKVKKWRDALTEVANLPGWDLRDRLELELIVDIVDCIWAYLNRKLSSDVEGLVGMDSRIKELEELLDGMESDSVRIIGIWGMPGVGKTITAEVFFKHISSQFDASCFLANVREKTMEQGLQCAQNELFSTLLEADVSIDASSIKGTIVTRSLHNKKVLIVLDDVSNSHQVEYLIGDQSLSCFGPRSTIIITSRDKGVLKQIADKKYTVEKLTLDQAFELFFRYAFRGKHSKEKYLRLSIRVIRYADGIPLALKVLGSSLYNESEIMWEAASRSLEISSEKGIQNVLRICYDGLENNERNIFLDVACFFEGEDINQVTNILGGCGFSADIGIHVLINKSFITILNNNLQMHSLIQEMGWEIVRQESKHRGDRSRLWIHEDINHILTTNMGTKTVEGIFLDMSKIEETIYINPEAFLQMDNLRLLKIYNPHSQYKVLLLRDGLDKLPDSLVYLYWHCCPLKSLPPKFHPRKLVELHMHYSHIIRLWEGTLMLSCLKWIDLSYSQCLEEIPDLSMAPNLERINLVGCTSLLEIPSTDPSLPKLQAVYLSDCSNLKNFPLLSWNVEELHLEGTAIEEVPSDIQNFSKLVKLNMKNCKGLKNLPSIHCKLESLELLDLSGCSSLMNFPEISWNLKELLLNETAIEEFPSSIEFLDNLVSLKLRNCTRIKYLPSSISKLKSLKYVDLSGCSNLTKIQGNVNFKKKYLEGFAIEELP